MRRLERSIFLVAAHLDRAEILELFRWVEQTGASRSAHLVQSLHQEARMILESEATEISLPRQLEARSSANADNLSRVEDLLFGRTSLSRGDAMELLTQQLIALGVSRDLLPPNRKQAFRKWLSRLSSEVPASLLLAGASRVRQSLQEEKRDWPLSSKT